MLIRGVSKEIAPEWFWNRKQPRFGATKNLAMSSGRQQLFTDQGPVTWLLFGVVRMHFMCIN